MDWLRSLVGARGGAAGSSAPPEGAEQHFGAEPGAAGSIGSAKLGLESPGAWKMASPASTAGAAAGGAGGAGGALHADADHSDMQQQGELAGSSSQYPEEYEEGEEGEESWYYGAEQSRRGWRHSENQLLVWVLAVFVVAVGINIGVSGAHAGAAMGTLNSCMPRGL